MAGANANSMDGSEDIAVKAVNRRFEGLMAVRTKANKGKGAWYWSHLEPILITNPETNLPKAVKLKCTLCGAAFSASNPSRTASEHFKKGICPNFSPLLKPISQLPPLASPSSQHDHRKRSSQSQQAAGASSSVYPDKMVNMSGFSNELSFSPTPIAQVPVLNQRPLILSGGKEDLWALEKLEDSVKKLKSPKASPRHALNKDQVDSAFNFLADWLYESCGSVSFCSLEHPKFKAFLNQVGLPAATRSELTSARLDSKFEAARMESETRIRDAVFFQVASDGWKGKSCTRGEESLVKFLVNLPNRTSVFQKAVYVGSGSVPSEYAEEVSWEIIRGICGNAMQRCIGIVSDKYKAKALRNLEIHNHWMVNLSCQLQGFLSLIKDFYRELPLFRIVTDHCLKIAILYNSKSQIRNSFRKFRKQGVEFARFIRVPPPKCDISKNIGPFIAMLEDILNNSHVLHLVVLDLYKAVCLEDPIPREVVDMIQDVGFWNDVEAVHALVMLITQMAEDIEAQRPLVGQCLPLWEELRAKVKDWCSKYNFAQGPVEKIVEKRFKRNYHPAWSAAFILDPLYLVKDVSGKYLPPFKCLTHEQEKDVEKLITRLVSREEAHNALMELMKWRSEGLDPLYAQAVQVKKRDPVTGKMKHANPQSSTIVWETCLKEFESLGKVAVRLLFLHATSCGIKWKQSSMRWFCLQGHSRLGLERAQKLAFIAAHAKFERGDFSGEEDKDAELFGIMSGEDDMLNEVLADSSPIVIFTQIVGWMANQTRSLEQSRNRSLLLRSGCQGYGSTPPLRVEVHQRALLSIVMVERRKGLKCSSLSLSLLDPFVKVFNPGF